MTQNSKGLHAMSKTDWRTGKRTNAGRNGKTQTNGAEPDSAPTHTITWRSAAQIKDGVPEWAWHTHGKGRLMRGTLTHFAGRPEAGKSTAARYFAAGYSNGTIEGCFCGKPQNVAYIASEESIEYWIKPSLRAHDADMSRIHFPTVELDGQKVPLLSTRDEELLTRHLIGKEITVVFVDPVMSTISRAADINKNNQIRAYIEPWQRIAEAINGLGVGIVHLIKAPGLDIVASINGSSAFGEVPRAVIAFANDDENDERILSQEKNSAGDRDLALTYSIKPITVETDAGPAEMPQFSVEGLSARRVSDVFRTESTTGRLGPRSLEVLEAIRQAGEPCDAAMITTLVRGLPVRNDASQYLTRLAKAGLLIKVGRGMYDWPLRAQRS
jgi:predicted ATP-dependent serine protease